MKKFKFAVLAAAVALIAGVTVVAESTPASAAAPDSPTNVRVIGGPRQVAVSWTAPTSGATPASYIVEKCIVSSCSWSAVTDAVSGTSVVATGLTNGVAVKFRVSAVNDDGSSTPAESASITPSASLTFETISNTQVNLGAQATRTACAPLTKEGAGPYTYTGLDTNGVSYSYTSDRSESGTTLRQGKLATASSMSYSHSRSANYTDGVGVSKSGVISLTSNGNIERNNTCTQVTPNVTAFGSIFGPEAYTAPFAARAGQSLAFDWAASNVGDDYEVYAFLVEVTDIDADGTYDTGSAASSNLIAYGRGELKNWTTSTGTISSTGIYRFRFVNGTYDYTGFFGVGATMYIDPNVIVGETNSITFDPLPDKLTSDASPTISASATSGAAIVFATTTSSVCTVGSASTSGVTTTATVTLRTTGLCTITADSAATGDYATAATVTRSFTIRASAVAPIYTGGATVSGTAEVGSTVTASEGTWTDGGSSISSTTYQWESSSNGSTWSQISGAISSTYVVTSSDANKYLRVKITKTNTPGSTTGTSSASALVTTPALPGAPTSLTVTPLTDSAYLVWTAPAGASGISDYAVQWSDDGGSTWTTDPDTSATASATVIGLSACTAYTFRVAATNGAGTGTASSEVAAMVYGATYGATYPQETSRVVVLPPTRRARSR